MTDETSDVVRYSREGDVALIVMDDGKVNAIGHDAAAALAAALDRAEEERAGAVLLAGRPGRFSAGFDLATMTSGTEQARDLLRAGAEVALRLYSFPAPVVAAVTGHAMAMGAILTLSTDLRIGTAGDYKIGLNEVAIGMPVPEFTVELARERLARQHLTAALNLATIYAPDRASSVGYLDELAEEGATIELGLERASAAATSLKRGAFRATRRHMRGRHATVVRAALERDLQTFEVAT